MLKPIALKRLVGIVTLFAVLASPLTANESLRLCDEALVSCEKSVEVLKQLRATDAEAIKMLIEQRNKAIEANGREASTPFYVWILVGGAAATILMGLK